MIKKTLNIHNQQERDLRKMKNFTVSEHIRRAIQDYIEKHRFEGNIKISQSLSTYGRKQKE